MPVQQLPRRPRFPQGGIKNKGPPTPDRAVDAGHPGPVGRHVPFLSGAGAAASQCFRSAQWLVPYDPQSTIQHLMHRHADCRAELVCGVLSPDGWLSTYQLDSQGEAYFTQYAISLFCLLIPASLLEFEQPPLSRKVLRTPNPQSYTWSPPDYPQSQPFRHDPPPRMNGGGLCLNLLGRLPLSHCRS